MSWSRLIFHYKEKILPHMHTNKKKESTWNYSMFDQ